ncbi:MAG: epoxyqueuosine reductase QueH [Thermoplasmata archaeon]
MNILLHVCCGQCLIYPYQTLLKEDHKVTGFFFNPNIHPYTEHKMRMDALRGYVESITKDEAIKMIYKDDQRLKEFLRGAVDTEDRCSFCYEFRLNETAKTAKLENFDMFTTTLLGSPHQKHDVIKEVGERVGKKHGVSFYYEDFRPGFNNARSVWRETKLYRQKYCGCIFSEMERYNKQ